MSTHDYNLANASGAAFRSDLNDALAAIVSQNSGTSWATTFAYQRVVDTSAGVVKRRNAANSDWITVETIDETFVLSRTSNTILDVSDKGKTIRATASYTQTLDAVATLGDGWYVGFRVEEGATLTFDPDSSETIDGGTTLTIAGPASGLVVCNGSALFTVGMGREGIEPIVPFTSLPAANSVTIQNIPQRFSKLLLMVSGASADTAARAVQAAASTDNGSTTTSTVNGTFVQNTTNHAAFGLDLLAPTSTQTAAQATSWVIEISGYQADSFAKVACAGFYADSTPFSANLSIMDTAAIDALVIRLNDTGNFDAGYYALFGVR